MVGTLRFNFKLECSDGLDGVDFSDHHADNHFAMLL